MTKQEQLRRARRREQRRRARIVRRVTFSLLLFLILISVVYCIYSGQRMKKLQGQISTLQQELKENRQGRDELQQQLEELERQLQEKEAQLQKQAEATTDHPEKPNVYLTFDDGPSSNTDIILDALAEANVRASFFCIAREGEEAEARYKRIVSEGHTLAMHSYTHQYKTIYADLAAFEKDVTDIRDFLHRITGIQPKFYRFPGGSSNTVSRIPMKQCIQYINQQNITYFDWNAQNDDATGEMYTAEELVQRAMSGVRAVGDNVVLLMHDEKTKTATAQSIPELIRQLREAGYDILPITDDTPLVQHVSYDSFGE